MDWLDHRNKQRILQELVPGKQITLAHLIHRHYPGLDTLFLRGGGREEEGVLCLPSERK